MAFSDEIAKPQRVARAYVRFSTADQTPSGSFTAIGDRRYGKEPDNTGDVPITAMVKSFGSFSRTLMNFDYSLETPTITTVFFDKHNEWRRIAAVARNIKNRWLTYCIRVLDDAGVAIDADIVAGRIVNFDTPPRQATLTVQMQPGKFLGDKVPRRLYTAKTWPWADKQAIGKVGQVYYGKIDSASTPQLLTAAFVPRAVAPSGFAASVVTGGSGLVGEATYYALTAIVGGVETEASIIGPITLTGTFRRVVLTWAAYAGASAIRVYRSKVPTFGLTTGPGTGGNQRLLYRYNTAPGTPSNLPGGSTTLTDNYVGYFDGNQTTPDTRWDNTFNKVMTYFVSAIVDGIETAQSSAAPLACVPVYPREVSLNWTAFTGATQYVIRRTTQSGVFQESYEREWRVASSVLSMTDTNTDTSVVTPASDIKFIRGGACPAYLIDIAAHRYGIAAHACKKISEVFVTKAPSSEEGGFEGEVGPPEGVHVEPIGTPGTTRWRYRVTSVTAGGGESLPTENVFIADGTPTLSSTRYNRVLWDDVEGASKYRVYGRKEDEDIGRLKEVSGNQYDDKGTDSPSNDRPPLHDRTSEAAVNDDATPTAKPTLQTEGVDYFVELIEKDGERWQTIRFVKDQGTNPVTVNLWGVESVGDVTGTLLEDPADVFQHLFLNWFTNDYKTGPWFTDTGGRPGLLDPASITSTKSIASTQPAGPMLAAGAMLEQQEVSQIIWEFVSTFDFDFYYTGTVFKLTMLNMSVAVDVDAIPQYTMQERIFRDSFRNWQDYPSHANKIPFQAGPNIDGFVVSGEITDDASIADYVDTITSPVLVMTWTRDAGTINGRLERRLQFTRNPRLMAEYSTPMRANNEAVGSLVAITHRDGISSNSAGWVQHVCRIIRSSPNFDRTLIVHTVHDLTAIIPLIGFVGPFMLGPLGDEAAAADYMDATDAERREFAYLADEDTKQFSNGDPAQLL